MEVAVTEAKWRQFLSEARARWHFLNADDESMQSTDEIAHSLSEDGSLSLNRSQREVQEMMELFEEKVRRAA